MEFTTGLMSLDTALNEMLSRVTPLTAQETLPLVQCFGRILASDVVSPQTVCNLGRSAGSCLYMPYPSFYIQKLNESFIKILIFIAKVASHP